MKLLSHQVAVAVVAGLTAATTVGLLPPPYDKWAVVIVAVLAGATRPGPPLPPDGES